MYKLGEAVGFFFFFFSLSDTCLDTDETGLLTC